MKTIPVARLGILAMTAGGERETSLVIHEGVVKEWVGIGWIELRDPTAEDRATIPQAIFEDGSPA